MAAIDLLTHKRWWVDTLLRGFGRAHRMHLITLNDARIERIAEWVAAHGFKVVRR